MQTSKRAYLRGYRSGLEINIAEQLKKAGREVIYEKEKISYEWPPRGSKYTPDFKIPTQDGGFFYVESKGLFSPKDRQKHLLIKTQYPDIDIRFVFSNQNQKLYKGSKTTYAAWCEKHGFTFANRAIPDCWLQE
jgi:hypothetical protein